MGGTKRTFSLFFLRIGNTVHRCECPYKDSESNKKRVIHVLYCSTRRCVVVQLVLIPYKYRYSLQLQYVLSPIEKMAKGGICIPIATSMYVYYNDLFIIKKDTYTLNVTKSV